MKSLLNHVAVIYEKHEDESGFSLHIVDGRFKALSLGEVVGPGGEDINYSATFTYSVQDNPYLFKTHLEVGDILAITTEHPKLYNTEDEIFENFKEAYKVVGYGVHYGPRYKPNQNDRLSYVTIYLE